MASEQQNSAYSTSESDRHKELKAFDNTKAGVKGLVENGITKVPNIFINPSHTIPVTNPSAEKFDLEIPVIDLQGSGCVVEQVRCASETLGFFQLVNHGIPAEVLDEMIEGVRRFNEQLQEVKSRYYTRDHANKFVFNSNFDLYTAPAACWRDTFVLAMAPEYLDPKELPEVCRDILVEYCEHVMRLGHRLFEVVSTALGLSPSHLKDMGCCEGLAVAGHYYPACPEPELTLGGVKHTDMAFLTILLQDQIGGLQVFHQNQWIDVLPIKGSLVINIGDFLQLVSNDKLKSSEHRIKSNKEGPRMSMACFFTAHHSTKLYGPVKELLSQESPPVYRDNSIKDYTSYFNSKSKELDEYSILTHFKL